MEPAMPVQRGRGSSKAAAKSAYAPPEAHPYRTIIDDVIRNSRDLFLEEGIDEQFLQQLQYLWEARLNAVLNPEAAAAAAAAADFSHDDALGSLRMTPRAAADGAPPSKRQGVAKEQANKPEKIPTADGAENEEEELGSDLDESEEQVPETDNLVLCQYEKVTRHKTKTGNRFKCVLKDGIMSLSGKEILFHKGTGDAED